MNRAKESGCNYSALRLTLIVFTVSIFFCLPQRAEAQQWTTNGTHINNTNAGNIGIGTATPAEALHLANASGVGVIELQGGATHAGFVGMWDGGSLILSNNRNTRTGNNFNTGSIGANLIIGNNGDGNKGDFSFQTVSSGTVGTITSLMRIKASGSVGIGTSSPVGILNTKGGAILFDDSDGAISGGIYSNTLASNPFSLWSGAGDFRIGTGVTNRTTGAGFIERVRIVNSNGYVGIGTTTPTAKLDVQGDINVSGNINAKYQDVAEWVLSNQDIPAGTVVVLDSQNSNHVISSSESYDTRVAGVISARPGISLGEAGPDKVLVATTGRVKIKVDATRAAIRIGDLLVTSDREGYAMKSEPITIGGRRIHSPGTLIGKALEPLEKGTGEILVLLSLQ